MIIASPYLRNYLFTALAETPLQLRYVLAGMTEEQSNKRFDPSRFTLREVVGHLADWDTVFRERITRMINENEPELPNIDEGERAIEKGYADMDWRDQLDVLIHRRHDLIGYLGDLPNEAWSRKGLRPEIGVLSVLDVVQTIPLHDLYHLKQAREYLA